MSTRILSFFVFCAALGGIAGAAPITVQEIDFHLRQQTPEAEILKEVAERRLLTALDAAGEALLKKNGATESLIAGLKRPEMVLPPARAQAEVQRQREQQRRALESVAEDRAAVAERRKREAAMIENRNREGYMRGLLAEKLVRLDGDSLKPAAPGTLENAKVIALYYSAGWCGPCRKFTPTLIAAYERLKEQYPQQFELIFVSADRDAFNMHEHMRMHRMPWPAVRFEQIDPAIRQFGGSSIPWLVAVAATGEPLTKNGVDKLYIAPEEILQGIEYLLTNLKP
jgi:nucleoredoxin